jgi:thiamine-monophosphate kinase
VVTVDCQVEGVHFRREWLTLREIGQRAVSTSVSDLAAMAARPVALLVSLMLEKTFSERDFKELHLGIRDAAKRYGARIIGGNLSEGPFALTITALGEGRDARLVRRSGARPGDEIWATGTPGLARLGLKCLEKGWVKRSPAIASGVQAFRRPTARVREAMHLARSFRPTAMIDLSDGLGTDIRHVLAESGRRLGRELGARLEEAAFLRMQKLTALSKLLGEPVASSAIRGGEDYELCFTALPRGKQPREAREFSRKFGLPLSRIGRIVEEPGLKLLAADGSLRAAETGWEHF